MFAIFPNSCCPFFTASLFNQLSSNNNHVYKSCNFTRNVGMNIHLIHNNDDGEGGGVVGDDDDDDDDDDYDDDADDWTNINKIFDNLHFVMLLFYYSDVYFNYST